MVYRKIIAGVCLAMLILSIVGCYDTGQATASGQGSTSPPDVSTIGSTPPTILEGTDITLPPGPLETEETVTIPTGDNGITPNPTGEGTAPPGSESEETQPAESLATEPVGEGTYATAPTEPTDPTEPKPAEHVVTEPTEPAPSADPQPTESHPAAPVPSATEPAESETTGPAPTEPAATVPESTNPKTTAPDAPDCESTPVETEPTEPKPAEHVHSYAVSDVVAPSCESGGYSVYSCSCGDRYKGNETAAVGHCYTEKVTAATCTSGGYTSYTCSACGDSYKDSSTAALGHSYTKKVTAPTCTEGGYTAYTCSACGDYYKSDSTSAVGHSYTKKVTEPTCTTKGYATYTCSACGHSYKADELSAVGHSWSEWVTTKEATTSEEGEQTRTCGSCSATERASIPVVKKELAVSDPATEEEAEVARLICEYINQFRAECGSTQLTYLPGMSQVAQYRSRQLVTNFDHDTTDKREALAYYKYGEYVDFAEFGCPELVDQNYYEASTQEAISGGIKMYGSAEHIASIFASAVKDSASHWRYVGSSENSYVGVGVTNIDDVWYVCIMVGTVNYG